MSKQSMHKSMARFGGGGESSSGTRRHQPTRDGDYEVALRLQKLMDEEEKTANHRRHPHKEYPTDSRSLAKAAKPHNASSRDHETPYPKEIQHALDEVQKFIAGVMETTCRKCDNALMRDFNVHRWFKQWILAKGQPQPTSICSLTCPQKECQALTCLGCGEKPRMGKFTGKIDGFHLDWCCESGRLFAIWSFLCELDNFELAEQQRSQRQVKKVLKQHTRNEITPTKKNGTGYGSGTGRGYTGFPETVNFRQADAKTDAFLKQIFSFIIELLPRRSDKSKAAPPALGSMIELSLVQDRIAELLRNDSLQDITTRAGLYFAVFELFERLGKHPGTSYLVYKERFVKKQSHGLFEISTGEDLEGKGKVRASHHLTLGQGEDRTNSSLLACICKLGIQSEALLKASRAVKSEFRTASAQDLLEVTERVAKLQLSMKPNSGSGSKSDNEMTWKEYNQKYCMTREENVLRNVDGRLAEEANSWHHSQPNRIKRLVTEASEMETSLPPNIFVKVDEVRPDVMKCLIVGPENTPYEAGLFEFDILCPTNYPVSPPSVIFRNTAQGRVWFNPNLHANGIVCLSLLGTWQGPPESKWQGAKSSILSVLVSIQAMIFTPHPMDNVPLSYEGYFKAQIRVPDSQSYESLVQAWTVRFAMLDWLQNTEMSKGLWRDVVRAYFERNGGAILDVVSRWRRTNKLIASFERRDRDLGRELANALQAFQQNRR